MSEFNPSPEFEEKVRKAVSAPDADPDFVNRLRSELARRPVNMKPRFVLRPAWVIALILALVVLVISAPSVAKALAKLLGYVPGIGLVENAGDMRVLADPVSARRDGITLTVEQVIVYPDHVDLSYQVKGIPAEVRFDVNKDVGNEDSFCFGEDSYPDLLLPDGSMMESDVRGLGGQWLADEAGYNAGHSFSETIPEHMGGATFVLKCLQDTKRGAAPEDWVVSFNLIPASDHVVVGEAVLEVEESQPTTASIHGITLALDNIVKEADGYVVYADLKWDEPNLSKMSIYPYSVIVKDASGQDFLVSLIQDHGPASPFDEATQLVFKTAGVPDDGPLTIVIDKVYADFTLDKTRPYPEGVLEKMSFTFDAGSDPQVGQKWALSKHFEYSGYGFDVTSARMVEQDGKKGYEFTIRSSDPTVVMNAELMDLQSPNFWTSSASPYSSEFTSTVTYDGEVPNPVTVTIERISVPLDGPWQVTVTPAAK